MTAKEQVLKVYKDATPKAIGIDNGHSTLKRYVIFKSNDIADTMLSTPQRTIPAAWQSALTKINENGKHNRSKANDSHKGVGRVAHGNGQR